MKYKELERLVKKSRVLRHRPPTSRTPVMVQSGNRQALSNEQSPLQEVATGTLNKIKKAAGI